MTPKPLEFVFAKTWEGDVIKVTDPEAVWSDPDIKCGYLGQIMKTPEGYKFETRIYHCSFSNDPYSVPLSAHQMSQILERINALTVSGPDAIQKD